MNRFPESFMFQLTNAEWENVRSKLGTVLTSRKLRPVHKSIVPLPYVFTEQGVAMLSAVLNSEIAVKVSIQIMNAFVK